jgi:hypothetical protein
MRSVSSASGTEKFRRRQRVAVSGERGLQGLGLREGARKPVQDEAAPRVALRDPLAHERHDQVVRHELALLHHRLRLEAERGLLPHGVPKDVARGDGGNPQPLREELCLGSLAAARRPEENDAHRPASSAVPGCGSS